MQIRKKMTASLLEEVEANQKIINRTKWFMWVTGGFHSEPVVVRYPSVSSNAPPMCIKKKLIDM